MKRDLPPRLRTLEAAALAPEDADLARLMRLSPETRLEQIRAVAERLGPDGVAEALAGAPDYVRAVARDLGLLP